MSPKLISSFWWFILDSNRQLRNYVVKFVQLKAWKPEGMMNWIDFHFLSFEQILALNNVVWIVSQWPVILITYSFIWVGLQILMPASCYIAMILCLIISFILGYFNIWGVRGNRKGITPSLCSWLDTQDWIPMFDINWYRCMFMRYMHI